MKKELVLLYKEYFKREEVYLKKERREVDAERKIPEEELIKLEKEVEHLKNVISVASHESSRSGELVELERNLSVARRNKDVIVRKLGQLEGELSYLKRESDKRNKEIENEMAVSVKFSEFEGVRQKIEEHIKSAEHSSDLNFIKEYFNLY